ncbi:MAG TPA: hypothetical protein VHP38_06380 [Ruminiclostridium sp.]|nr:hypothetical protein [Ruminiclostridium sp.]
MSKSKLKLLSLLLIIAAVFSIMTAPAAALTYSSSSVKTSWTNQSYTYYAAAIVNDDVQIQGGISYSQALSRINAGQSVMAYSKSDAYDIAYAAGKNKTPVGPEIHGELGDGYYYHYHVYNRTSHAHIWYYQ